MDKDSQDADPKGTVEVTLRFWRNYDPSNVKKGHRGSGGHLPEGLVWPAGTVEVLKQTHAPSSPSKQMVNNSFDWMEAIREALKDAGVTMVQPGYLE
jgi:hypothetical protein